MLLANETVAAHLEQHGVPTLYRVHEEPDPAKVEIFEEFISTLGYSLPAPARRARAARLPAARREDSRQAGGEADRVPDAADDAEGAVRPGEPRPLRPGGASLHALHVADPPLSRPRRASRAARVAARHERGAARGARRGSAGDRAAHVGARAARQRRRARARAVEEGPVHGRQGRRRVRRLRHRRQRLRPLHRARRALRRGHGARLDDGRRLLPVRRARAHPARREERPRLPARRSRATCR